MAANIGMIRLLSGERLRVGASDDTSRFRDQELVDISAMHGDDLYLTVSTVWAAKAGELAPLVDTEEHGSKRASSQFYAHCVRQARFYAELAEMDAESAAEALRVVGSAFDAYSYGYRYRNQGANVTLPS